MVLAMSVQFSPNIDVQALMSPPAPLQPSPIWPSSYPPSKPSDTVAAHALLDLHHPSTHTGSPIKIKLEPLHAWSDTRFSEESKDDSAHMDRHRKRPYSYSSSSSNRQLACFSTALPAMDPVRQASHASPERLPSLAEYIQDNLLKKDDHLNPTIIHTSEPYQSGMTDPAAMHGPPDVYRDFYEGELTVHANGAPVISRDASSSSQSCSSQPLSPCSTMAIGHPPPRHRSFIQAQEPSRDTEAQSSTTLSHPIHRSPTERELDAPETSEENDQNESNRNGKLLPRTSHRLGRRYGRRKAEDSNKDKGDTQATYSQQYHHSRSTPMKPRWQDSERLDLLEAVIKEKNLNDMSTFRWDRIALAVGRAKKACKDQWRREVLPALRRSIRSTPAHPSNDEDPN
ncbi:uncharacterized protein BYT42DRAFT_578720 [Radiomyces spectabilis]|uniref:uncharacterized protein n=1 Tax=Radiomyces spectabilis TaxID=64574 RepID=UPI0022204EA6|nr:uncharacterized protein BYT42DRAFT_578720 [Radiomyces spectabilis]KAI8372962.1 hypothetical protein BYT42DRAFT_578720 [Radiomyces spectabilis]